jgi:hypothetical protein
LADPVLAKLQTTSSRLLAMAIALLGESEKVRQHMNFNQAELLALLAGDRELTWDELGLLTTLLVREQGSLIAQNRELIELIRLRATRRSQAS